MNKNTGVRLGRERAVGIDQLYIKERYYYMDGRLFRKKSLNKRVKSDFCEWCIGRDGYRYLSLKKCRVAVHRLIWILFNGEIPEGLCIDHINRNRLDNRIENLRIVNHHENMSNHGIKTKSGYPGVWWYDLCKTWQVRIQVKKKTVNIGYYKDLEEAIAARKEAEAKYTRGTGMLSELNECARLELEEELKA